ncbi:MAG: hypothetical protein GY731_09070 [Gammaproteobacteria bacterium]|nr:hypothetical protein [Gammaproteobacteria bacterium]
MPKIEPTESANTGKSISPENPRRKEYIQTLIAAVMDGPEFELPLETSKDRVIQLVSKRLERAKRLDENQIVAELLLLRHQNPDLFGTV